ncbi:hypothetical protein D3C75_990220 [compost metagenome]
MAAGGATVGIPIQCEQALNPRTVGSKASRHINAIVRFMSPPVGPVLAGLSGSYLQAWPDGLMVRSDRGGGLDVEAGVWLLQSGPFLWFSTRK